MRILSFKDITYTPCKQLNLHNSGGPPINSFTLFQILGRNSDYTYRNYQNPSASWPGCLGISHCYSSLVTARTVQQLSAMHWGGYLSSFVSFTVLSYAPEDVYVAFNVAVRAQSELKWKHLKNALDFSVSTLNVYENQSTSFKLLIDYYYSTI